MKDCYIEKETNYRYSFLGERFCNSLLAYAEDKKMTKNALYNKLSEELLISPETVRKHKELKIAPGSIEDIYHYGSILEGDRYAFLLLRETEDEFFEKADEILRYKDFAKICVQAIRVNIVKILSEYAATKGYMETEAKTEDLLIEYRQRIDAIECLVYQIHGNDELVRELLEIVDEFRQFVCSCEVPGVIDSWYEINPNLKYYSWEFEKPHLLEKAYKMAKFHPTEKELEEYRIYSSRLRDNNHTKNYHYTDSDFFQRELIITIDLIFKKRIREVFNI